MHRAATENFSSLVVPDEFGSSLKASRVARGWTQSRLAHEAGLKRETVVRLEAGRRKPSADTVFRLEAALNTEPGTFVPAWPEWSPMGSAEPGARSRERRRALGLSIVDVAKDSGISKAMLSRFEREIGACPTLASYAMQDGVAEIVELLNHDYAKALGFDNAAVHLSWCLSE